MKGIEFGLYTLVASIWAITTIDVILGHSLCLVTQGLGAFVTTLFFARLAIEVVKRR